MQVNVMVKADRIGKFASMQATQCNFYPSRFSSPFMENQREERRYGWILQVQIIANIAAICFTYQNSIHA